MYRLVQTHVGETDRRDLPRLTAVETYCSNYSTAVYGTGKSVQPLHSYRSSRVGTSFVVYAATAVIAVGETERGRFSLS